MSIGSTNRGTSACRISFGRFLDAFDQRGVAAASTIPGRRAEAAVSLALLRRAGPGDQAGIGGRAPRAGAEHAVVGAPGGTVVRILRRALWASSVVVLSSQALSAQAQPALALRHEFTLPGADAGVSFAAGSAADVAPDGSILVADLINKTLYRFSADGSFRDSLGRAGDGPGEFRGPSLVAAGPENEVAVGDIAALSVTVWTADRRLMGATRVRGQLLGLWWSTTGLRVKTYPFGSIRAAVWFSRFSPGEDSTAAPDISLTYERNLKTLERSGIMCEPCPATVTPEGEPVVADADPNIYRVSRLTPEGRPAQVWERPGLRPVPRSRQELDQIRTNMERVRQRFQPELFRYKPIIASIAMDEHGRLWVLRNTTPGDTARLDVLDPQSRLIATLAASESARRFIVRRGRVLFIDTSAEDEPVVAVFRVVEGGGVGQ